MTNEQGEADERDETLAQIAEEQALEQRPIPFMGDDLAAARTAEGAIYVTLPGMCRALGLNAQAQYRRISRTPALAKGLRFIPIDAGHVTHSTNCLRIDRVALWLAGVESSRIKPQFRAKIEAYQDELAPVAMQVFMRVLGVQPATSGTIAPAAATAAQIGEIAEQLDTLLGVVSFLREHLDAQLAATSEQMSALSLRLDDAVTLLEALGERQAATDSQIARIDERTQRLTPAHARAIQEQVDQLVRETKRLATPLTYAIIYGRLKHRFRANSYREIADDQYERVIAFLHEESQRATQGDAPTQERLL
jgi:P22_AR N-terminal domain